MHQPNQPPPPEPPPELKPERPEHEPDRAAPNKPSDHQADRLDRLTEPEDGVGRDEGSAESRRNRLTLPDESRGEALEPYRAAPADDRSPGGPPPDGSDGGAGGDGSDGPPDDRQDRARDALPDHLQHYLDGASVESVRPAEDVNAELCDESWSSEQDRLVNSEGLSEADADAGREGWEASKWHDPYTPGTEVVELVTGKDLTLTRNWRDVDGGDNRLGDWLEPHNQGARDERAMENETKNALVGSARHDNWTAPLDADGKPIEEQREGQAKYTADFELKEDTRIRVGQVNPGPDRPADDPMAQGERGGQPLHDASRERHQVELVKEGPADKAAERLEREERLRQVTETNERPPEWLH